MEEVLDDQTPSYNDDAEFATAITVNAEYVAFATNYGVFVRNVDTARGIPLQQIRVDRAAVNVSTELAFSSLQPYLLAVSSGAQVLIFNASSGLTEHVLHGNGRTVCSIVWSPHDAGVLATASIDGVISLWNLDKVQRPIRQFAGSIGPLRNLIWSLDESDVLACSHGSSLDLWSVKQRPKCVNIELGGGNEITGLSWRKGGACEVLVSFRNGTIGIWSLWRAMTALEIEPFSEEDYDEILGELEGVHKHAIAVWGADLDKTILQATWLGKDSLLTLTDSGYELVVDHYAEESGNVHAIWQCTTGFRAATLSIKTSNGSVSVIASDHSTSQEYVLPNGIVDQIDLSPFETASTSESSKVLGQTGATTRLEAGKIVAEGDVANTSMKPISISDCRQDVDNGFSKTSTQLQHLRRRSSASPKRTVTPPRSPPQGSAQSTPPSHGMTSTLELPGHEDENDVSPMPFLSPSVPSRRVSPYELPPVDESLHLPPVESSSFESISSTALHDSDSDDDTFAGNALHGSGTLLPGGVNVPLPKACGALFAPNGQLLTYFPPRPKQLAEPNVGSASVEPVGPGSKTKALAKLFPSFGNLLCEVDGCSGDEGSDLSDTGSDVDLRNVLSLNFQASSFQSHRSWAARISPTKPSFTASSPDHKVVVKVVDLGNVLSSVRKLAAEYRIFCQMHESGADLCRHNAQKSDLGGLKEVADIWRLLAMLLEDNVPLQVLSGRNANATLHVMARQASFIVSSGANDHPNMSHVTAHGRLRWAESPLGGSWLVNRIFEWAEQRADVQMLACMSAILAMSTSMSLSDVSGAGAMSMRLATHGTEYHANIGSDARLQPRSNPIPVLRTDAMNSPRFHDSPTKLHQSSHNSSRNASQPTTPRLDPAHSTPPFGPPAVSRQGSRLSASGSVSPEHHRSSFSAAAKYYAQSITDKFASYGTSPPAKKNSSSPGNELSASLPLASGSWSKSVSFASTAGTARDSQLSKALANDDDSDDSDRTIDDSSIPHTPKSPAGGISMLFKNQDYFSDNISGCAELPFLSDDLATKGVLWRQHYAGLLRSWDLAIQATELEKVAGLTGQSTSRQEPNASILPVPGKGRRRGICSICRSVVAGLEQVCLACLHVTHLTCLEDLLTDHYGDYYCSTGCGCACMSATPADLAMIGSEKASPNNKVLDRKRSITDPRLWRAGLEGDSW